VTKDVDDGDVDDGLELAQQEVRQHRSEYGGEVAEHGEGMVDHLCKKQNSIKNCENLSKNSFISLFQFQLRFRHSTSQL